MISALREGHEPFFKGRQAPALPGGGLGLWRSGSGRHLPALLGESKDQQEQILSDTVKLLSAFGMTAQFCSGKKHNGPLSLAVTRFQWPEPARQAKG